MLQPMATLGTLWCVAALVVAEPADPPRGSAPVVAPATRAVDAFNRSVSRAIAHRRSSRHAEAVAALDAALNAIRERSGPFFDKARSRARFYKALSLVALRRYQRAQALLRLLSASPGLEAQERTVVAKRLDEVSRLRDIERANTPGEVTVEALDPAGKPLSGAVVTIDGRAGPSPPFTVRLAPGRHVVQISHSEFVNERQTIRVEPGASLKMVLRPSPPAPWSPPGGVWATGGSALALASIGGLLHGLAAMDYSEAEDKALLWRDADALVARGDHKVTSAYVLYGVAGALFVGAVLWAVADAVGDPQGAEVRGGLAVGVAGVSVSAGGAF